MPPDTLGEDTDFDRHFRRAVWIALLATLFGAVLIYADKATEDRSAFVRWRHQVLQLWDGVNIYDAMTFPTPPVFPIALYPLAVLPKVAGAVVWFVLKAALTVISIWLCFRMARPPGTRTLPSWVQGPVLLLCLRPILSDLHHANNNLVIMFLIVGALYAWRKEYDVLAGLTLSLAISFKVTPALFVPYLLYKRSWRAVGATCLGMGIFLLIVPSLIIGPTFNGICLATWWQRMMSPFLMKGLVNPQEINQSMVGVLTRLLSDSPIGDGGSDVNLVSWSPATVALLVKAVSIGLIGLLVFLCRTRATRRDDPRLLGEFSLVVLTMLFLSERSWKHHYVTLLLPATYLTYRVGMGQVALWQRVVLGGALTASAVLMASTSTELGGHFLGGQGHKIAQGYGMFLWAGVVQYGATAWCIWMERTSSPADNGDEVLVSPVLGAPAPHLARKARPILSAREIVARLSRATADRERTLLDSIRVPDRR